MSSDPTIAVEMLFETTGGVLNGLNFFTLGSSQLDGGDVLGVDQVWVDITDDVRGVNINRGGRTRDIDAFRAGSCAVELDNHLRTYDPTNTLSEFYGNILPMRQIRVRATPSGGSATDLFHGFVESWTVEYEEGVEFSTTTAECVDAFQILGAQMMDTIATVGAGETTGARVTRVLDLPEVDFDAALRDIDTGLNTVVGFTGGSNPASYLQQVAASEFGSLFVSRAGSLTFRERNNFTDTALIFSDDGANIRYETIAQEYGVETLYNRVVVSGDGITDATSADTDSQAAYRVRNFDRTVLLDDQTQADGLADAMIGRFSTPELRFTRLDLLINNLSAADQAPVLALELADLFTVERTPPGGGSPAQISLPAVVDGLRWRIGTAGLIHLAIDISSSETLVGLVLDSASLGVLDNNRLGY